MKYKKLLDLIENSKKILITSHFAPDPDSIGSLLYVYGILKENFKDKRIEAVMEDEIPSSFTFLPYSSEITKEKLINRINDSQPDLLIMLDGNNYIRFSRNESEEVREIVKENGIKSVIIDHHLENGRDEVSEYINKGYSSTAETVYTLFKEDLKLKEFEGSGDLTMFGILGDTGRFLYKNPHHRNTFRIASDLIDGGVDIEKLQNSMGKLKPEHLLILSELLRNFSQKENYNFSYLSDEFVDEHIRGNVTSEEYGTAYNIFTNQYLRDVEPNTWGFVLLPDIGKESGNYRGSFRAANGNLDTTVFSNVLGGGGHRLASGFSIKAKDYLVALDTVHKTIKENSAE